MRALRPMTQEEREFAEKKHDLVIDFLRCKHLLMDDFYDVVIFGYLSARVNTMPVRSAAVSLWALMIPAVRL